MGSVKGTGLFPSVMMAQAILESGNGESLLAKNYNNHFGIKASPSWRGKRVNLATEEVSSGLAYHTDADFRVYDSAEDSFTDRNKILLENPAYNQAGVFKAVSPEQQAMALQVAGYASDLNYSSLLINIIDHNNLTELDREAERNRKRKIAFVVAVSAVTCAVGVVLIMQGE